MPTKKLSGICTLHLRYFAFTSVPHVLLCTLLYESFSLSFQILEDPKEKGERREHFPALSPIEIKFNGLFD